MKTLQKCFGLLVIAAGPFFTPQSFGGGVCRAFTDTRGRTVNGHLMDFDDVRKLVSIQRADNHVIARASLSDFSDSDQRFIRAWDFERDFNDLLAITVCRKSFKTQGAAAEKHSGTGSIENICYEVQLVNRSDSRFESVEVEYCVFYRQGNHERGSILFDDGVQYGRVMIDSLTADTRPRFKTSPVKILNDTGRVTAFGRTEGARGEVQGLWLRVHATTPSGSVITREHCSPAELSSSKAWIDRAVAVGLNHVNNSVTTAPAIRLGTVTMPSIGRLTIQ